MTQILPSAEPCCDRDKRIYFVSANFFVTVTAEQFEMVQYPVRDLISSIFISS